MRDQNAAIGFEAEARGDAGSHGHRNEAEVHAAPALLGIRVPVKVAGRPLLRPDGKIDFDTSHLSVSVLPLPSPVLTLLERRINPILDLASLKLPLELTDVRIEPGFAMVQATARLAAE